MSGRETEMMDLFDIGNRFEAHSFKETLPVVLSDVNNSCFSAN